MGSEGVALLYAASTGAGPATTCRAQPAWPQSQEISVWLAASSQYWLQ